ncbi:unnamed protein product [Boreogadus saida]
MILTLFQKATACWPIRCPLTASLRQRDDYGVEVVLVEVVVALVVLVAGNMGQTASWTLLWIALNPRYRSSLHRCEGWLVGLRGCPWQHRPPHNNHNAGDDRYRETINIVKWAMRLVAKDISC